MAPAARDLANRVLLAGYRTVEPPGKLLDWLGTGLAGVIFFKRNFESPAGLAAHARSIVAAGDRALPPLRAIDQEGGRVARLGPPVITLPPMRALAEVDDPELTFRAGRCLGRQLVAVGVSLDLAPVIDVDSNPDNPIIGDRSFSADPAQVVRHATRFAEGLHEGGCLSCGKHFPGHGDTVLDSHLDLPRVTHGRERLEHVELAPFRALSSVLPSIMTAHVVFDAIDPSAPATLSKAVLSDLLRDKMRYEGVIMSDDLEMKAIADRWPVPQAAVAALRAGCDLLLVCSELDLCLQARDAIAEAAERDSDFGDRLIEAASRVDSLRARMASDSSDADEGAWRFDDQDALHLAAELRERCRS